MKNLIYDVKTHKTTITDDGKPQPTLAELNPKKPIDLEKLITRLGINRADVV